MNMDEEVKLQFVNTFSSLIMAAFGLVAALAWNEAIKAIIAQYLASDDSVMGLVIYAVIVTILAVIITFWIARSVKKLTEKIKESKETS